MKRFVLKTWNCFGAAQTLVLHQPFFPSGKGRTFASDHFARRVEFETVVAAREDLDLV